VAVDSARRLYVADRWNNRIQVFDASGAYLTTIGGEWVPILDSYVLHVVLRLTLRVTFT